MKVSDGKMKKVITKEQFEELCDTVVVAKVDENLYFGMVDDHNLFITPDGRAYRFDELEEIYAPANSRYWLQYDYYEDLN